MRVGHRRLPDLSFTSDVDSLITGLSHLCKTLPANLPNRSCHFVARLGYLTPYAAFSLDS